MTIDTNSRSHFTTSWASGSTKELRRKLEAVNSDRCFSDRAKYDDELRDAIPALLDRIDRYESALRVLASDEWWFIPKPKRKPDDAQEYDTKTVKAAQTVAAAALAEKTP